MRRSAAVVCLLCAAVARAEQDASAPEPSYRPAALHDGQTAAIPESHLVAAEGFGRLPDEWTGDIRSPGVDPRMARLRAEHRQFVSPFIVPSVFPDVSLTLANDVGWNRATDGTDLDQVALMSLYFLRLTVPLVTLRNSASVSPDAFRVAFEVPWVLDPHQAVALFVGSDVPMRRRLVAGGFDTMLGYAWGEGVLSAQARAGVGVERLLANERGPFAPSVLYDLALGVHLVPPVELVAQVDGRKVIGAANASVRLWPAVRFFPEPSRSLSIGVGGLFWFDDLQKGWVTHRVGGVVDVGYAFL